MNMDPTISSKNGKRHISEMMVNTNCESSSCAYERHSSSVYGKIADSIIHTLSDDTDEAVAAPLSLTS